MDEKFYENNSFKAFKLAESNSIGIYDLKVADLVKNTWCTAYTDPSPISSITPGFITNPQNNCRANFDDTTETFAFTRPVIATSSTCTVASNDIWTVWVEP